MENALVPNLFPEGDLADVVHPATSGYEKMASVWYNALNQILPAGS